MTLKKSSYKHISLHFVFKKCIIILKRNELAIEALLLETKWITLYLIYDSFFLQSYISLNDLQFFVAIDTNITLRFARFSVNIVEPLCHTHGRLRRNKRS